jgi:hypothetical protein
MNSADPDNNVPINKAIIKDKKVNVKYWKRDNLLILHMSE